MSAEILTMDATLTTDPAPIPTAGTTPTLVGYTPGVPPWLKPENAAIDRRICARLKCPCGHRGLTYTPFFRLLPRSYRAKATCPCCGHVEEI